MPSKAQRPASTTGSIMSHSLCSLLLILVSTILCTAPGACEASPCKDDWYYNRDVGKCYYFLLEGTMSFTAAKSNCTSILSAEGIETFLADPRNLTELLALDETLAMQSNMESQWISATRDSVTAAFRWSDGLTMLPELPDIFETTGLCAYLARSNYFNGIALARNLTFHAGDCSELRAYTCVHNTNLCPEPNTIAGYLGTNMTLNPYSFTGQTKTRVACKSGFYRYSELPYATTAMPENSNAMKNWIVCNDSNSFPHFRPTWNFVDPAYTYIEDCQPIACAPFTGTINNIKSDPVVPANLTSFPFGYMLNVTCLTGYHSHDDDTRTTSAMVCAQDDSDPARGVWSPLTNTPCMPVRCNQSEIDYYATQSKSYLSKAVNIRTKSEYNNLQLYSFPLYDNIVTFQCDEGQFFKDRTSSKTMQCTLQDGTQLTPLWVGYQGTFWPFPACERATCRVQEVIPTVSNSFKSVFLISYDNGSVINATSHAGVDYNYKSVIRFWCLDNYQTATKASDQNLTCQSDGSWSPSMTGCIKVVAPVDTGGKLVYTPPPEEAPGAESVGTIVIIIMVLFFSCILILDLSTLARDLKIMRGNVRHLRDRWQAKGKIKG